MQLYWSSHTSAVVPPADDWLSAQERGASNGLLVPKRRADWRLGRWTAKCAIAARLEIPLRPATLSTIEVRPAASGAPVAWVAGERAGLALSLSHSRGVGFCVLADAGAAIGCDVEFVEPRSSAFTSDYFTPREQAAMLARPPSARDRFLTFLWSTKESVLKALGCGLRGDPASISVNSDADPSADWRAVVASDPYGHTFQGWCRATGQLVWTAVADPAPIALTPLRCAYEQ